MKKFMFFTSFLLIGCGVWPTEPTVSATDAASTSVASSRFSSVFDEIEALCRNARQTYSTRYARAAGDAKQALILRLTEIERFVRENPTDASVRSFATGIDVSALLQSADSPNEFREKATSALFFASSRTASNETGPAVEVVRALEVYLDACLEKTEADADAAELRLADEEREYFGENCDLLSAHFAEFWEKRDAASFDALTYSLGELTYYQPDSPAVARLEERVRELFSDDNFYFEISESTLDVLTRREIDQRTPVNEVIRGTKARGQGVLRGLTRLDLRPNASRAEIQIVLNGNVATRTIGENRGVFVNSDNFGRVVAAKTLFWSDEGVLTLPSVASGSMRSRVNNVKTDRMLLFGGTIVQSKVAHELPLSEAESARLMSERVASELDLEMNRRIVDFNERWLKARQTVAEEERMIRRTASRTDDDRLYFSCLLGRQNQFASPMGDFALNCGDCESGLTASNDGQATFTPASSQKRAASASVARRYSSVAQETVANSDVRSDVVFRAHQSAPNNAAFVALGGLTLGEDGLFDALSARFPGIDRTIARNFLEKYRRVDALESGDENREKAVFQFAEERPFEVFFVDDKIETTLRFASFATDGRAWPEMEIKFVYKIAQKENGIAFQRESVDVLPGGLDPDAPIPARFQAFRSVVMKRLEAAILDEYLLEEFPLDDPETGKTLGVLVPTLASAQDGWFAAEFQFREISETPSDERTALAR